MTRSVCSGLLKVQSSCLSCSMILANLLMHRGRVYPSSAPTFFSPSLRIQISRKRIFGLQRSTRRPGRAGRLVYSSPTIFSCSSYIVSSLGHCSALGFPPAPRKSGQSSPLGILYLYYTGLSCTPSRSLSFSLFLLREAVECFEVLSLIVLVGIAGPSWLSGELPEEECIWRISRSSHLTCWHFRLRRLEGLAFHP